MLGMSLKGRRFGTRKHPGIRTPDRCPKSGRWTFTYLPRYDPPYGVQRSTSSVRCTRARSGPRGADRIVGQRGHVADVGHHHESGVGEERGGLGRVAQRRDQVEVAVEHEDGHRRVGCARRDRWIGISRRRPLDAAGDVLIDVQRLQPNVVGEGCVGLRLEPRSRGVVLGPALGYRGCGVPQRGVVVAGHRGVGRLRVALHGAAAGEGQILGGDAHEWLGVAALVGAQCGQEVAVDRVVERAVAGDLTQGRAVKANAMAAAVRVTAGGHERLALELRGPAAQFGQHVDVTAHRAPAQLGPGIAQARRLLPDPRIEALDTETRRRAPPIAPGRDGARRTPGRSRCRTSRRRCSPAARRACRERPPGHRPRHRCRRRSPRGRGAARSGRPRASRRPSGLAASGAWWPPPADRRSR